VDQLDNYPKNSLLLKWKKVIKRHAKDSIFNLLPIDMLNIGIERVKMLISKANASLKTCIYKLFFDNKFQLRLFLRVIEYWEGIF
jgi:hypothetical protein